MAKRKNESLQDIRLYNFIKEQKVFANSWTVKKVENIEIQEILDRATKKATELHRGEPDLIYVNENKRLLILVDRKSVV